MDTWPTPGTAWVLVRRRASTAPVGAGVGRLMRWSVAPAEAGLAVGAEPGAGAAGGADIDTASDGRGAMAAAAAPSQPGWLPDVRVTASPPRAWRPLVP
ncbi:hypothetical protein GCM10009740_33050 [Terrabacter terrae]|uniref:Uncharacterized protein n=1 Tax=Terrabacter terrae TaxID=318434 RepID=A0ABP5G1J5_9MICO